MSKIERFEDLIAWQKARILTRAVYRITQEKGLAQDFGLSRQMQRAAVSIMSNIAEGFERGNHKEFRYFLTIAKGSCAELRTQLYIALDVGYLSKTIFDELMSQSTEVGRIIGGLRISVEKTIQDRRQKRS